jgi:hypothetical protein
MVTRPAADIPGVAGVWPMRKVSAHGRYGKRKLNKIARLPAIKLSRL